MVGFFFLIGGNVIYNIFGNFFFIGGRIIDYIILLIKVFYFIVVRV